MAVAGSDFPADLVLVLPVMPELKLSGMGLVDVKARRLLAA